jgi:hypothetical protein
LEEYHADLQLCDYIVKLEVVLIMSSLLAFEQIWQGIQ